MGMSYFYDNVETLSDSLSPSTGKSDNNVEILSDSLSPSTDEDASTLMLASTNPKRRAGRKKFKETRHPIYRGIRQRNSDKWVCEVRQPKKQTRIWLGTFPTAEMAARAHDVAVLALRGPHGACLNFSDSAWRLPIPVSSDTKDIQKAAVEAAELFRPVAKPVSPKVEETVVMPPENNVFYLDEDEEFGMVELVSDMYQGLLMSPPRMDCWSNSSNYGCDYDDDNMEFGSLWSYSF